MSEQAYALMYVLTTKTIYTNKYHCKIVHLLNMTSIPIIVLLMYYALLTIGIVKHTTKGLLAKKIGRYFNSVVWQTAKLRSANIVDQEIFVFKSDLYR